MAVRGAPPFVFSWGCVELQAFPAAMASTLARGVAGLVGGAYKAAIDAYILPIDKSGTLAAQKSH